MTHPKGFMLKDRHVAFNKQAATRIKTSLNKAHPKGVKTKRYKVTTSKHTAKGKTGYVIQEWVRLKKR